MLCPKCGASVGDDVRLCAKCEATEKPAPPPEEAQASSNATTEEPSAPVENVMEEGLAPPGRGVRYLAVGATLLISAVCLWLILTYGGKRPRHESAFVPQRNPLKGLVGGRAAEAPVEKKAPAVVDQTANLPLAPASEKPFGLSTATSSEVTVPTTEKQPTPPPPPEPAKNPLEEIRRQMEEGKAGTFGYGKAGDEKLVFADQVAMYYPKYARLDVGFYADVLNATQRTQILQSGEILASKNERRPTVVVSLPLDNGNAPLSPKNLIAYTLQFYREFGRLNFPGYNRFVEFSRSPDKIAEGEVPRLDGALTSGGKIEGIILGFGENKPTKTPFEWGLRISTQVSLGR